MVFVLVLIIFSWVVYQTSQGQPLKPQMVWAQELQKGEDDELTLVGSAFPISPLPANIGFLKKGIKDEESLTVRVSKMDIYYRTDGKWQKEEKMSNALRPSTEEQPYGYVVP